MFGNESPVSYSEQKLYYMLGPSGALYDSQEFGLGRITDYEIVEKLKAGQELYIIYPINSYDNIIKQPQRYRYETREPIKVEK